MGDATFEGTEVRKGGRAWKFQQHVGPQRNMAVKICSAKTWHKTVQPYIILFKDWGGVGRGRIKRLEGKILCI